jgi:hypothetical protein
MGTQRILRFAQNDIAAYSCNQSRMTDYYHIEKLRRRLKIVLKNGRRLEGEIFLRPISRHRPRPEQPMDLLNDDEPFFALVNDGAAVLVAKANVARAETSYERDDDAPPILEVPVEVTLSDGSICKGSIFLESRSDRPRLMDFLNSYAARFLPLVAARQVCLVNTQSIAHVREVA